MLSGCEKSLREGLSEGQANDVEALLHNYEIGVEKERSSDGNWQIHVNKAQRNLANQLLYTYNVPREKRSNLGQIFPGGGLMTSETEENIRYQYGLSEELAKSLEDIDGVLSARVHVALPNKKNGDARREKIPPSASVMIRHRSDLRLELIRPRIQSMVAAGMVDGRPENVSILAVAVIPSGKNNMSRFVPGWFGVHYRPEDFTRVLVIYLLPWFIIFFVLFIFVGPKIEWKKIVATVARLKQKNIGDDWENSTKTSFLTQSKSFFSRRKKPDE